MKTPSSPHEFTAAILAAEGDVARQRELFKACPFEWRALVREGVNSVRQRRDALTQHAGLLAAVPADAAAAPVPKLAELVARAAPPEVGNAHLANIRSLLGRQP